MNKLACEIIWKDILLLKKNKRLVGLMCLVPIVLTIVMPTAFIISINMLDDNLQVFSAVSNKFLQVEFEHLTVYEQKNLVIMFFLKHILPIFFMLIPTMISTIISANSFIGEKEKYTLETLFLSPIKINDIFVAKVSTSLVVSMGLTMIIFVIMSCILNIVLAIFGFHYFIPSINWIFILLFAGCAITIISTTLVISKSKKADTAEEAQQVATFIILPIIALVVGQFAGFIFISHSTTIILSILLLSISIIVLKAISKNVSYDL